MFLWGSKYNFASLIFILSFGNFPPLVHDFLDYYIKRTLSLRPDVSWLILLIGQRLRVTRLKPVSLNWLDIQLSIFAAHTLLKTLSKRPRPCFPLLWEISLMPPP